MSDQKKFGFLFSISISLVLMAMASGCRTLPERKAWRELETREVEYLSGDVSDKGLPSLDKNSTLQHYIRYAALNNPELKAAFYKWKAALLKIPVVSSLPDPMVSYTRYIDEVETRVGPQENRYGIMQMIPLPDKLSIKGKKAFETAEAKRADYEHAKLMLFYEATDAYCEYAYLAKAVILVKENIKLLEYFEKVAQIKFKSGVTKSQDLIKVQVELGKLSNDLITLEDLEGPLRARLNAVLNRPFDAILPNISEIAVDFSSNKEYSNIKALVALLIDKNPELKKLEHKIAESEEELRLAKREYFPDLTVGASIIDTGPARMKVSDSGKDPVMLSFTVNMPIWFSKLKADVERAESMVTATTDMKENKENKLLSKLKMIHYRYKNAERQVKLYKDALLPKAEQSLKTSEKGYEGNLVGFLTLIDDQRILLSFQLAYHRAIADYHQRLAEMKMLLGEEEIL